jgi:hypothetical protein
VDEIVEETPGPFRHVAAGAYVTALARLKLLEGMETAIRNGAQVYYCDTDSIVIDRPIKHWGGSTELGSWELESTFTEAEFLCPKVYRARDKSGKLTLKAKGTNLKSQLEQSEPKDAHEHERLMRWAVYARDISQWAATITGQLTDDELGYYGKVQAGLLGWRSSVAAANVSPTISVLDRMARNPDSKRAHGQRGMSRPLYLEGEGSEVYLDVRTLDPESLLEMELESDPYRVQQLMVSDPITYVEDE